MASATISDSEMMSLPVPSEDLQDLAWGAQLMPLGLYPSFSHCRQRTRLRPSWFLMSLLTSYFCYARNFSYLVALICLWEAGGLSVFFLPSCCSKPALLLWQPKQLPNQLSESLFFG